MEKEWKHYYGNYYVSNEGEIKNFKTKHAFKNNLCNQHTTGIPCVKMDLDGNILETFPSLLSAAKSVNGYYNGIYKTCVGEYSQYKGYIWKYLKDINSPA